MTIHFNNLYGKRRFSMRGFRTSSVISLVLGFYLAVCLAGCFSDDAPATFEPCANIDCGEGVCALQNGEPVCQCFDGYITQGLSCIADPCTSNPCVFGLCRVVGGVASCQCDEGYAGTLCEHCDAGYRPMNGRCIQGDPCEDDPCAFGVCAMIDGEKTCVCHEGYAGEFCDACADGYHAENLTCQPDSPCSPNPCFFGTCILENGLGRCECDTGYTGTTCDACAEGYVQQGATCISASSLDPCDPNPCTEDHRTQCLDMGGEAACACDNGYLWDGEACVEEGSIEDPCDPNPCTGEHRGVCLVSGSNFTCLCDDGYREGENDACVLDTTDIPVRSCGVTVQLRRASAGPIYLRGEINSWSLANPLVKNGDVWEMTLDSLDEGDYAYKLYDQSTGEWFLDPNNPYTKYVEGVANSRLRVPDCEPPLLELLAPPVVGEDSIRITVGASYGRGRVGLDAGSVVVRRNGEVLNGDWFNPQDGVLTVEQSGLAPGKYSYLFEISDTNGLKTEPLFVPVWIEAESFDWRDASLYFVLTDRFHNGDESNDAPVQDSQLDWKANWQGGDFAGIREKIEDGYFSDLGINALWISSPIMNTEGAFWGSDGHKYSGYHSYWPISTGWTGDAPLSGVEVIDPHFGTLEEFKALVQVAHEHGIRIVVDFVANHVHSDSPLYEAHLNETSPWFHWNNGVPGQGYVCGWERPIDCWFAEYLPDLEYKNLNVMKTVMDHAIWLIQETNIDGFRLDAVKHMILDFSTTIRARIGEEIDTHEDIRFYMVGETFTGENGQDAIAAFVGSNMLDGQFDFPLFWASLKALVRHEAGLSDLKNFVVGNMGRYGSDAVMSNFLGNHDVPRVLSHADGSIGDLWGNGSKEQGWTSPPGNPSTSWPYARLRMAWTFLFAVPGVPLIYYGDEIGLPGAGDPDNRRMMVFEGLDTQQQATLEHVGKIGKARLDHPALRTGELTTLSVDANYWAYVLKKDSDVALVVLNRGSRRSESFRMSDFGVSEGDTLREVFTNSTVSVHSGRISVTVSELDSAVYVLNP